MAAIGMAMLWAGYTLGLWGWTLVKGYDIPLAVMVKPGAFTGAWPPPMLPPTVVLRVGGSVSGADNTAGAAGAAGATIGQIAQGLSNFEAGTTPAQNIPAPAPQGGRTVLP